MWNVTCIINVSFKTVYHIPPLRKVFTQSNDTDHTLKGYMMTAVGSWLVHHRHTLRHVDSPYTSDLIVNTQTLASLTDAAQTHREADVQGT